MTSPADNSLKTESQLPETGSMNWPKLSATERDRRVTALFAELACSSPLYAAKVEQDPDYWRTYSVGAPNMFPEELLHIDPKEAVKRLRI